LRKELIVSNRLIAALAYADGVYPDRAIARAIEPLWNRGIPLAGVIQLEPADMADRHPCDLLLKNLATGEVTAIAEHRGKEARGCRLDIALLTEVAEAVVEGLHADRPRLLVVNKFGKIEADGGGLRRAIAEAVDLGIPVLIGVPARNLGRWRAFAGSFAVELPAESWAIVEWLQAHGLPAGVRDAIPSPRRSTEETAGSQQDPPSGPFGCAISARRTVATARSFRLSPGSSGGLRDRKAAHRSAPPGAQCDG
jgi:hypothetical protein